MRKILKYTFLSLVLVFVLLAISIQLPFVQQWGKDVAISFFENKTGAKVKSSGFGFNILGDVWLNDLVVDDPKGDQILASQSLEIDLSMAALLKKSISLEWVEIRNLELELKQDSNEIWNYDFIVNAFSSSEKKEKSAASNEWQFSPNTIVLEDVQFTYISDVKNDSVILDARYLKTDLYGSDFIEKIHFNKTEIDSLSTYIVINQDTSGTGSSNLPTLFPGTIHLRNSTIHYYDGKSTRFHSVLPTANLTSDSLNLNNSIYDFKDVSLLEPNIQVALYNDGKEETPSPFYFPDLQLHLENVQFEKGVFSYQSFQNDLKTSEVNIADITSAIPNFNLSKNAADFSIQAFQAFFENLKEEIAVSGNGVFDTQETLLESIQVKLASGDLSINGTGPALIGVMWDSTLWKGGSGRFDVDAKSLLPEQLYSFASNPDSLPANYRKLLKKELNVNAKIKLNQGEIQIPNCDLHWNETLNFQGSGGITNAWVSEELQGTINIKRASIEKAALDLLNDLSNNLTDLKNPILIEGIVAGNTSEMKGTLRASTETNQIDLDALINLKEQSYRAQAEISAGNYVQLIRREGLPTQIGGRIELSGKGFDYDSMALNFKTQLQEFEWKEYNYQKIIASGNLERQVFTVDLKVDDPNFACDVTTRLNTRDTIPNIVLKGSLTKGNFNAINVYERIHDCRAIIDADLQGSDPSQMNGYLRLDNVFLQTIDTSYRADSFNFVTSYKDSFSNIQLESDLLSFSYAGDIPITSLQNYAGLALKKHLPIDWINTDSLDLNKKGKFSIQVDDLGSILSVVVPGLSEIKKMSGEMELLARDSSVIGSIDAKKIVYQGFSLYESGLNTSITRDSFETGLWVDSIIGAGVKLPKTSITGQLRRDTVYSRLQVDENDSTALVKIVAKLFRDSNQFKLAFVPGQQIINKEKWKVNKGNFIEISRGLDYNGRVKLYNDNKYFQITGKGKSDSISNYDIVFQNLELAGFTSLMEDDFKKMNGYLSGNLNAKAVFKNPLLNGQFELNNFSYDGETYGNLEFSLLKDKTNNYKTKLNGSGDWLDLEGQAQYQSDYGSINGNLDIKRLGITPFEPFVRAYADSLTGQINGDIALSGTTKDPKISGKLYLNEMTTSIKSTHTRYRLKAGRIDFNNENVILDALAFTDREGNNGTLNGNITINTLDDISYDFQFQSKDFLFLDTKQVEKLTYYGEVQSSVKLDIKGDLNQTIVDGIIFIDDGTSFKMALPEITRYDKKEGLITFVNRAEVRKDTITAKEKSTRFGGFENHQLEVNARIEIDEKASLTIIMDPRSGDKLTVAGAGNLVFRMEKSGFMSMNGNYQVSSGSYNFSFYKLIRRDFSIQKGSTLNWTGDPLNPVANITGIYQVETSPSPLLADEQNYSARLPFEVTMNIDGPIQEPKIDYAVRLSQSASTPNKSSINSRLTLINRQQNEKSKQVFGLLVLGGFLTPDNQTADNTFTSTAYRSLSEMLTSQLNQLSKKYIKGVDINFGLDLNETQENLPEAQVSLNLQKELFNENVVVSVGGTYQNRENQNASNLNTDIKVSYKLTKDGRFQLSVFRKGEYEGDIEGDVIKTGVTIVFMKNFDQFKEIFEKTKSKDKSPW